ncbi:MAG: hypothetical protein ACE5EL_03840, partial [Anaerolineae bacterium]
PEVAPGGSPTGVNGEAEAAEGSAAAVDTAAAIDLALSAPLPHAIDLTGGQPVAEAASPGTTLTALLEGKSYVATGAFPALAPTGVAGQAACHGADCVQVEFFDFSDATAIVAVVDPAAGAIVDVRVLTSGAPAPGPGLTATVMKVIDSDPRVARAFEGQAYEAVMGPGAVTRQSGPCAEKWCVLVSLAALRDDGTTAAADDTLLVFVDMGDQTVVDAFWRSTLRNEVQP